MNQWRRVQSPYDTRNVLVADRRGSGLLNRDRQVRLLPGTLSCRGVRNAAARATEPRPCLVMRLASQPHCPWGETGSIPVRGARIQGCRVMVTGRASNPRREGSIPSRPAGVHEAATEILRAHVARLTLLREVADRATV